MISSAVISAEGAAATAAANRISAPKLLFILILFRGRRFWLRLRFRSRFLVDAEHVAIDLRNPKASTELAQRVDIDRTHYIHDCQLLGFPRNDRESVEDISFTEEPHPCGFIPILHVDDV